MRVSVGGAALGVLSMLRVALKAHKSHLGGPRCLYPPVVLFPDQHVPRLEVTLLIIIFINQYNVYLVLYLSLIIYYHLLRQPFVKGQCYGICIMYPVFVVIIFKTDLICFSFMTCSVVSIYSL